MKLELSTVKWHINNIDPNNASTSRNELTPSVAKMRHDFSDNQIEQGYDDNEFINCETLDNLCLPFNKIFYHQKKVK